DLDDGLTSGLLKESDLKDIPLWHRVYLQISKKYAKIDAGLRKYLIIRSLIDMQVTDLIQETEKKLKKVKPKSNLQIKKLNEKMVSFSKDMQKLRIPLRQCLIERLYQHYRVVRMSNKAKRFIQELFGVYINKPEALPPSVQKRIPIDGVKRAVCDYIAGMTDRYALDEYKKLFDPYEKV
ncbi:MAG: deoxyguanosinetriphosphate triphosphohydrolase, partial [Candidatus Omnitrophica bacterium]|nr:deoxyguanosinetriphosphate triphosphohydrolase [Candidatus Omnitrophota bacterium]